jgi:molybdopterin-containing oxidoreductase family membrane subunit
MKDTFFTFLRRSIGHLFKGSFIFYFWVLFLVLLIIPGVYAYYYQFTKGLIVTNLSDQVSWGAYIANFTFLVGVAAASVLLVVPAYVYHHAETKEIVLLGELLAVSAIVMCLLFIVVDMGRPDHFMHILPFVGRLNFPSSVLAWDVIVLNVYLVLNIYNSAYLLYKKYKNEVPQKWIYMPTVYISIFWAVSIHTVTAFLYSGLGGRPFWNSAILAPRFLVSAFAGGPAILSIVFRIIENFSELKISEKVFVLLKKIVAITMPLNMFLLGCEIFKEFYTDSLHVASARYLYFGLHGAHMLQSYILGAIALNFIAMIIFITPKFRNHNPTFLAACVMAILGIWTEKGMGLIIPGFIPSPLGDIVEYTPSLYEIAICLSIWAIGALLYTVLSRMAIGIMSGKIKKLN